MLTNYTFLGNGLLRLYFGHTYKDIQLTTNSGKIVWREKANGTIKHTGIELGYCIHSREYFYVHNHPKQGFASVVTYAEFAQGNQAYYEQEGCVNNSQTVLSLGLNSVLKRVPYKALSSNCQNLTNGACSNQSYSQDVNKFLGVAFFSAVAIGIGIAVANSE